MCMNLIRIFLKMEDLFVRLAMKLSPTVMTGIDAAINSDVLLQYAKVRTLAL